MPDDLKETSDLTAAVEAMKAEHRALGELEWDELLLAGISALSPTELLALAAKGMSEEERERAAATMAKAQFNGPIAGLLPDDVPVQWDELPPEEQRQLTAEMKVALAALLPEQDASSQGGDRA